MGFQSKHILEDEGYPSTNLDNYTISDIQKILRKHKNKKLTEECIKTIILEIQ